MVLILPSKRKFYNSLKENFEINNINTNDVDIEDITTNLLSSKHENEAVILYFLWNDIGLMQRVSPNLHNIHSMKVSLCNFLRSHGGIDTLQSNTIILFNHWNQMINCLQLLFTNSDYKWSRREKDKEDCAQLFIISKHYDQYEPIITRQPYLFNLTLNDQDPLFSITSNTTSSSSKIIDYITGPKNKHNIDSNNNNNNDIKKHQSQSLSNQQIKHDNSTEHHQHQHPQTSTQFPNQ